MSRVLHITNIPTPYRIPQLNEIGRQLRREGWELKVVFGRAGYGRRHWRVDLGRCDFDYEVLSGAVRSGGDGEGTVFIYNGLSRAVRAFRPDLIMVTGFSVATLKVLLLSRLRRIPYLIFSGSTGNGGSGSASWRDVQRRLCVRYAAGGIAYGSQAKAYLERLGMPSSDIHIAINTVDVEFYRSRTEEQRRAAGSARRWRTLLYIGHLTPRKRPEVALLVAGQLARARDDFRLVMVGDGPSRPQLVRLADELGIRDRVQFEGYRQQEELPAYLATADCFLFPTRYDVWGLVLNEAMAAGVPCLASVHAGATHDLVQDGVTGFAVDFEDSEAVARRVQWILDHPDEAAAMGERARRYVTTHASLERSAGGFVTAILRASAAVGAAASPPPVAPLEHRPDRMHAGR